MTNDRTPFRVAVGLLRRTTPFLLLNVVVYSVFFVVIAVWLGIFGGLAYFFSSRLEVLAFVFGIIAIIGPWGLLLLARRYLLYLVQGAHIAVATRLLFDGQLPEGQGQVAYGRAEVQRRFRDVSVLFAVDRAVHGVVRTFTRRFVNLADRLPLGDGVSKLARIAATVVNRSVSYVDEAILSYAILREQPNVWRSARHGVILYAQAYKPILGAAVKIWLLGRAIFVGLVIVLGIPAVLLLLTFDEVWFQIVVLVAVVVLAWLIAAATYEPFAMIYSLVTYHRAIDGVEVNAVWDQRLQQVSNKFKGIVDKARQGEGGTDPLDTATVSPEPTQTGGPAGTDAPTSTPPGASPAGGATGGVNPLAGLQSMSRGGGVSGIVGGLLSQIGQPSQDPPSQNPPPQPPAAPPGPSPDASPPEAPPPYEQPPEGPPAQGSPPYPPPPAGPPASTSSDEDDEPDGPAG